MTSAIINSNKLLGSSDDLIDVHHQLLAAEKANGLSELHTDAVRILQKQGARLVHSQGHLSEVVAFAISPNGRYLATGSWVGDDYERGGAILIWDIEMGRCVNVLDPIDGGVGWPEYPHCIYWTNDNEKIAVAFSTNSVGLFDPFGEKPDPIIEAAVTDGWSRPPAFCVSPDGKQAYIACWDLSKVPGVLVSFETKKGKRSSKTNRAPATRIMAPEIPVAMREKLENGHLEPAKHVVPSPDGKRVHCVNSHGFAYAITLGTGELEYVTKVGLPAVYRPDGRFLAHTLVGLVFYDGQTGLPTLDLPMHMGMNALHWGKRGESWRLAGVVSAENECKADPGVHIYDDNKYRYSIDVKPREPSWDDGDFNAFAWAPSGDRAAVLDEEGKLHLVTLGESVVVDRVISVADNMRGVFWAAPRGSSRQFVIVAHREALVFIDADTGEVTAEHTFRRAPETTRPLDTGEMDLADRLRPDPTFVLDKESWGAAFPEGLVIAPLEKLNLLDAHLTWSVHRRHAIPTRWGGLEVVSSAADVAKASIKPAKVNWKNFKPAKSPKKPVAFPPPNPANHAPLYDAVIAAMAELGRGWSGHVAENLRHACLFRARSGDIPGALGMVAHIIGSQDILCAQAELTAIAYRKGQGALLDEEFAFVEEDVEAEIEPYNEIVYAMAMFAAYTAKKDATQSASWLARAKAKLEPETNPWQYRLALIWTLVQADRIDEARALFTENAPWKREPLCFYSVPFVTAMIREGHTALLFEFLEAWKTHRYGNIDWSLRNTLGQTLAAHGQTARLEESGARFQVTVDDERLTLSKSRETSGMVLPSPTTADIEMLAHDFAELQKIPRARRAGATRTLIQKAAGVGHGGAVITLLPGLDGTDFNHRPQAALNALWTITTGFEVVPW